MISDPLYRIRFDPESFALEGFDLTSDGTIIRREVSAFELVRRLCESGTEVKHSSSRFYLACLVLRAGERVQRLAIQRLTTPRTRNIKTKFRSNTSYLADSQSLLSYAERPTTLMEIDDLNSLLTGALEPLKKELKLPAENSMATCYSLTDGMYEKVQDEAFKQTLDRFITSTGIPTEHHDGTLLYADDLKRLQGQLEKHDSDLWEKLKTKILKTESREHLSAVSLVTGKLPGQTYISLANTHGHYLTMESWKFVALLEKHDSARKLADLRELRRQEPETLFDFNQHKEGEVFAKLIAEKATLQVVCRSTKNNNIDGRANFVVDIDYLLCIYIALKRLREDHERFIRLKEEADSIICPEVFDQLFQ